VAFQATVVGLEFQGGRVTLASVASAATQEFLVTQAVVCQAIPEFLDTVEVEFQDTVVGLAIQESLDSADTLELAVTLVAEFPATVVGLEFQGGQATQEFPDLAVGREFLATQVVVCRAIVAIQELAPAVIPEFLAIQVGQESPAILVAVCQAILDSTEFLVGQDTVASVVTVVGRESLVTPEVVCRAILVTVEFQDGRVSQDIVGGQEFRDTLE
jgi:hypothetical protein